MLSRAVFCILFAHCVLSRHFPRYTELDEEDQHLFRAAYDTPSYDQDNYQEDDGDMSLGKLDLLKDGLWAVKAKIKEMKAFNKALVANLLTTKLKVKELLANSIVLKKHQHGEDKKKPYYQSPAQYGSYGQAAQPQYGQQAEAQYAPAQHPQEHVQYAQYGQQQHAEGQYAPATHPYDQGQYAQKQQYAEAQYAPPAQHIHDPYYGI